VWENWTIESEWDEKCKAVLDAAREERLKYKETQQYKNYQDRKRRMEKKASG
jgi:hypothetical protein